MFFFFDSTNKLSFAFSNKICIKPLKKITNLAHFFLSTLYIPLKAFLKFYSPFSITTARFHVIIFHCKKQDTFSIHLILFPTFIKYPYWIVLISFSWNVSYEANAKLSHKVNHFEFQHLTLVLIVFSWILILNSLSLMYFLILSNKLKYQWIFFDCVNCNRNENKKMKKISYSKVVLTQVM